MLLGPGARPTIICNFPGDIPPLYPFSDLSTGIPIDFSVAFNRMANVMVFGDAGSGLIQRPRPTFSEVPIPSGWIVQSRRFLTQSLSSQSILATVHWFALVGIELLGNIELHIGQTGLKLSVTTFADANGGMGVFHDPQVALRHDCSLAHSAAGA